MAPLTLPTTMMLAKMPSAPTLGAAPPLLVHANDSDLCSIGTNRSTPAVPDAGVDDVDPLPSDTPPETRTTSKSNFTSPYDVVEAIIAHLIDDLGDLKACSLTCRSWYSAAVPHLHHTLTLRRRTEFGVTRGQLRPLHELHRLGLIPFVKDLRVEQISNPGGGFAPQAFVHDDLRYFSAFVNVHTLKLHRLEIYRFVPFIMHYFGHFSPTLRSIVLFTPNCTTRQLLHFLSLFSNLDDIEIEDPISSIPDITVPNTALAPFSAPKLRGRLVLRDFRWVNTWIRFTALCGGLRFRHIDMFASQVCAPTLLKACANTLETLRFRAMDVSPRKSFCTGSPTDSS